MHRVFRQIATLALFAAIALSLAACGGKGSAGGGKDVAATVNGKEITLADVDRIVNQQLQGQQLSTPDMAAASSRTTRRARPRRRPRLTASPRS